MEGEPWLIVNAILGCAIGFTGGMNNDPVSSSQAGSDPEHVKQIFLRLILHGLRNS